MISVKVKYQFSLKSYVKTKQTTIVDIKNCNLSKFKLQKKNSNI